MKRTHDLLAYATIRAILVAADFDLRAFNERLSRGPLETVIITRRALASQTHRLACTLHLEKLTLVPNRFEVLDRPAHATRGPLLLTVLVVELSLFTELSLSSRIFIGGEGTATILYAAGSSRGEWVAARFHWPLLNEIYLCLSHAMRLNRPEE